MAADPSCVHAAAPEVGTESVCTIAPAFESSIMSISVAVVSSVPVPVARSATRLPGVNAAPKAGFGSDANVAQTAHETSWRSAMRRKQPKVQ